MFWEQAVSDMRIMRRLERVEFQVPATTVL